MKISPEILNKVKGLKALNSLTFKGAEGIESDTRAELKGKVFIAFSGQNFDGHNFIDAAVKAGAVAVIGETKKLKTAAPLPVPVYGCKNSIQMYASVAAVCRQQLTATVIALTGSAGKTSVKELIKLFAEESRRVTATTANNNNNIGVPKTIFSAKEDDQILVLECGTNHFGEIPFVAPVASPDIALITNIGDSHLEYLINRKGVLTEKRALLDASAARGGLVLLNIDDPLLKGIKKDFTRIKTVSLSKKADYTLDVLKQLKNGERILLLNTPQGSFRLQSPLLGDHSLMNILLAAAATLEAGCSPETIRTAIKKYKAPKGRLHTELLPDNLLLIDDSYNANPDSMKAGINVVRDLSRKNKVLILGDMFELGAQTKKAHTGLKKVISECKPAEVILTGTAMKELNKALQKAGEKSRHFETKDEAIMYLAKKNFRNAVVLVKGSRGMKMEVFAEYFRTRKGN